MVTLFCVLSPSSLQGSSCRRHQLFFLSDFSSDRQNGAHPRCRDHAVFIRHRFQWNAFHGLWAALAVLICCLGAASARGQSVSTVGFDPYVTFAGNFDVGYRNTQFFAPAFNTAVGQWDTRAEFWLPPFRKRFSWGPYVRVAGIAGSQDQAWQNGWLGRPGAGLQMYPFSAPKFRKTGSIVGRILGPLRLYGEYNRLDYWGETNTWRPRNQTRVGAEYWGARHVNDLHNYWWTEIWSGAGWQSANEFDPHYHGWIFANAVRSGIRRPNLHALSAFTPYLALESSLTDHPSYYWENKLSLGGGVRCTPPLNPFSGSGKWLNRFVIYAEYMGVASYYREPPTPPAPPRYDIRAGISFSIGEWYH